MYETSDFGEMCFLLHKRFKPTQIINDGGRRVFVFTPKPSDNLLASFWAGLEQVEPVAFLSAVKSVKSILFKAK